MNKLVCEGAALLWSDDFIGVHFTRRAYHQLVCMVFLRRVFCILIRFYYSEVEWLKIASCPENVDKA